MRFKVNSKILLNALLQADFEVVFVADVSLEENVLTITFSNFKIARIAVESLGESFKSSQLGGWRWVAETLGQVSERCVVVGVDKNNLTLTFEY